MMRLITLALAAAVLAVPAFAEPAFAEPAFAEDAADGGMLNPEEMTLGRVLDNVAHGQTDLATCAAGYYITKSGRHKLARAVFKACAAAGYTGAMTWMSQLDDNGLGASESPDSAAEWDRKAASAGDPVGSFNLGLDLLRGRGVVRDDAAGRALIDTAAAAGLPVAQRMQTAGYSLDEVTPDADNWKYAPAF